MKITINTDDLAYILHHFGLEWTDAETLAQLQGVVGSVTKDETSYDMPGHLTDY